MKYRIEERPFNNKGGRSFRPWKIVRADSGKLEHSFTSHAIAMAAWELLERGQVYTRHLAYRKIADEHRHPSRR